MFRNVSRIIEMMLVFIFHSGAQKNAIFIDSSTIDPLMSQKISIETLKKGAKFLDGPVSGGNIFII